MTIVTKLTCDQIVAMHMMADGVQVIEPATGGHKDQVDGVKLFTSLVDAGLADCRLRNPRFCLFSLSPVGAQLMNHRGSA